MIHRVLIVSVACEESNAMKLGPYARNVLLQVRLYYWLVQQCNTLNARSR